MGAATSATTRCTGDRCVSGCCGSPVQIDGKTRFRVQVPAGAGEEEIAKAMAGHPDCARHTRGATVSRVVIVPGRIVNIVTRPRHRGGDDAL
jgi:leucyl-tRNA synthetase